MCEIVVSGIGSWFLSGANDTDSWDPLDVPVDTRFDGLGDVVVFRSTSFRFLDLGGVVEG